MAGRSESSFDNRVRPGYSHAVAPNPAMTMKYLLICFWCCLCASRVLAAELLMPGTFLTHTGIYAATNATFVRELTIQTNKLWLNASMASQISSAGSYNWVSGHDWFVYVGSDLRVWAFNGDRFFILLEANAAGARTVTSEYLKETPPAAVMKRLPRSMRKALSGHQGPTAADRA